MSDTEPDFHHELAQRAQEILEEKRRAYVEAMEFVANCIDERHAEEEANDGSRV